MIQFKDSFSKEYNSMVEISCLKIIHDLLKDSGFAETNEIYMIEKVEVPIIIGTCQMIWIKFDINSSLIFLILITELYLCTL